MAAQIRFFDSRVMFIYLEEKAPKKFIQKIVEIWSKSFQSFGVPMAFGCPKTHSENKVVSVINNIGTHDVHTHSFEVFYKQEVTERFTRSAAP
jgi:hypothetical protein